MSDGVQIQTDQVGEFGQGLRHEAAAGFASAADRGAGLHRQGVALGSQINDGPILEVKRRYAEALANTDANLRLYPLAAGVLADVAEEIARRFAHADRHSAVTQQEIRSLLDGALGQAQGLVQRAREAAR